MKMIDEANHIAEVTFEYKGVRHVANYDLIKVIPGTSWTFEKMGMTFGPEHYDAVLKQLNASLELSVDQGVLKNPPEPEVPEYTPPPEQPAPETEPAAETPTE
jgi:hypothetical protein